MICGTSSTCGVLEEALLVYLDMSDVPQFILAHYRQLWYF